MPADGCSQCPHITSSCLSHPYCQGFQQITNLFLLIRAQGKSKALAGLNFVMVSRLFLSCPNCLWSGSMGPQESAGHTSVRGVLLNGHSLIHSAASVSGIGRWVGALGPMWAGLGLALLSLACLPDLSIYYPSHPRCLNKRFPLRGPFCYTTHPYPTQKQAKASWKRTVPPTDFEI